ncbi:hypothetical protein AVEN_96393-1 [Araneus ventricosus]|uniref:Uncharacterized protein n=1 Tax=Araneus ventricosus TaxID=182803 RepID=A0A4Y2VH48_ARAVE|nr:hypothetical protein AVEN_96393-1 [Araneus ventricosus]
MNSSRRGFLMQHNRTMRSEECCMRSTRGFAIARSALCVARECGAELLSPQRIRRLPFMGACTWLPSCAMRKGAKTLTKRQGSTVLQVSKNLFHDKTERNCQRRGSFSDKRRCERIPFSFTSSGECDCACATRSLPFEQGSNSFVNRKLFCFEGASRNKTFSFHWLRNFMRGEGEAI